MASQTRPEGGSSPRRTCSYVEGCSRPRTKYGSSYGPALLPALAHSMQLEQVRRPCHPHRPARDDHEHITVAHGAILEQGALDLLQHLVRGIHLADESGAHAPVESQSPLNLC